MSEPTAPYNVRAAPLPVYGRSLRPALRYPGGKWRLAPWIMGHFPPHTTYCEPYMGACSVFIQKSPAPLEIINDIDGRLVNFFHVLRNDAQRLIDLIRLTPWSRQEFEFCKNQSPEPVEDARRFFTLCWQTIGRRMGHWRFARDYETYQRNPAYDLIQVDHLLTVAQRFKLAQIECRSAPEVIAEADTQGTLFYLDPPYLKSTRQGRAYIHEMTVRQHRQLAEQLQSIRGYAVISGYMSRHYRDWYERAGWQRVDTQSRTNRGAPKTESLWLSPRTVQALAKPRNLSLF